MSSIEDSFPRLNVTYALKVIFLAVWTSSRIEIRISIVQTESFFNIYSIDHSEGKLFNFSGCLYADSNSGGDGHSCLHSVVMTKRECKGDILNIRSCSFVQES